MKQYKYREIHRAGINNKGNGHNPSSSLKTQQNGIKQSRGIFLLGENQRPDIQININYDTYNNTGH